MNEGTLILSQICGIVGEYNGKRTIHGISQSTHCSISNRCIYRTGYPDPNQQDREYGDANPLYRTGPIQTSRYHTNQPRQRIMSNHQVHSDQGNRPKRSRPKCPLPYKNRTRSNLPRNILPRQQDTQIRPTTTLPQSPNLRSYRFSRIHLTTCSRMQDRLHTRKSQQRRLHQRISGVVPRCPSTQLDAHSVDM